MADVETANTSGLNPENEAIVIGAIVRFLEEHRAGPTITEKAVYIKYKERAEQDAQFARWLKNMIQELHEVKVERKDKAVQAGDGIGQFCGGIPA